MEKAKTSEYMKKFAAYRIVGRFFSILAGAVFPSGMTTTITPQTMIMAMTTLAR
jgi:hypothetical protein